MSLTGRSDTCLRNPVPVMLPGRSAAGPPSLARWIHRNRAAIEATATITLAMTAPVLAAVAAVQTSA